MVDHQGETDDASPEWAFGETSDQIGAGLPPAAPPPCANTVDGYRILRELGRGGMGAVYLAQELASGREVALKMVLEATGPAQAARQKRFQREGELTARLDHPGIVRVHAAGTTARGCPYLVYELVSRARTLTRVLPSVPLDERVRLIRDAARALGFAHAQGVVHRDVKGENLLVDGDGRVRVADFGLATASDVERLTLSGGMLGTPSTMSPEQVRAKPGKIGPPADVWALGVVLYEALTGRLPFQGPGLMAVVAEILKGLSEPPSAVAADVPQALEEVCIRALRLDPRERYPDGSALAEDLDAFLAGRPVTPGPRRATALALGAALMLPVLVAGGLLATRSQPAPEEATPPAPPVAAVVTSEPAKTQKPESAEIDLRRLERRTDPAEIVSGADAWLTEHPSHSSADEVRRMRAEAWIRRPIARVPLGGPRPEGDRSRRRSRLRTLLREDGSLLVYRASRGGARAQRWQREGSSWTPSEPLELPPQLRCLAPLPRDRWLATLRDGTLLEGDSGSDGALAWTPIGEGALGQSLRVAPEGWACVTWSRDGEAIRRFRRTNEGVRAAPEQEPVEGPINDLDLSRDGRVVAWVEGNPGRRGHCKILFEEEAQYEVSVHNGLSAVAVSPQGTWVAIGSYVGGLRLRRPEDPDAPVRTLRALGPLAHNGSISSLAFSPDGARLCSFSGTRYGDHSLKVWNVDAGALLYEVDLRKVGDFRGVRCADDVLALTGSSEVVFFPARAQ